MNATEPTTLVRQHVVLHERALQSLEALRDRTELSSDSDIVHTALVIYQKLACAVSKGKTLVIRDEFGHETPISHDIQLDEKADNGSPLVRRNILLHWRSASRLTNLQKEIHADSKSEVIRSALITYNILIEYLSSGNRLIIKPPHGEHGVESELPLLIPEGMEPTRQPIGIFTLAAEARVI